MSKIPPFFCPAQFCAQVPSLPGLDSYTGIATLKMPGESLGPCIGLSSPGFEAVPSCPQLGVRLDTTFHKSGSLHAHRFIFNYNATTKINELFLNVTFSQVVKEGNVRIATVRLD